MNFFILKNKLWRKIICLACVNCLVSTYFIFLISARKERIQNAVKLNADRNLTVPSEAACLWEGV